MLCFNVGSRGGSDRPCRKLTRWQYGYYENGGRIVRQRYSQQESRYQSNTVRAVGLAGGPGSGKSTVAGKIKEALRDQVDIIPMDGYHYSCSELNEMENPEQAHERRGAPFTFNSRKLVDDLIEARRTGSGHVPDFDHKERDPVEGRISLKPGKRIVIED